MNLMELGIEAVERGIAPDLWTRLAIRRLCRQRLTEASRDQQSRGRADFLQSLRTGPIALVPEKANEQHYELPPEFFAQILGPRRKYSCCYFEERNTSLAEAEERALEITSQRAELTDGQDILELGCGWGSLALWIAQRYPNSRITAVSNSEPQRRFLEREAAARGLKRLRLITADMNRFSAEAGAYDRVVSVEMFEHMRNYELLFARIAGWLKPTGKLFLHVFCHRELSYPFDVEGAANWMGRYFFSGGMMPGCNLYRSFDQSLRVTQQHAWNGLHYRRTAEAWLANLDRNRRTILPILADVYGPGEAPRWLNRWRMFFLAVAELFGYAQGEEWFVSHYLMERVT